MSDKTVYKLLQTAVSSKYEEEVGDSSNDEDGENDCEVEVEQLFLSPSSTLNNRNSYQKPTQSFSLGLSQLRLLLCLISMLLVVIIIAQLSTYDRNSGTGHRKQNSTWTRSTSIKSDILELDVEHSKFSHRSAFLPVSEAQSWELKQENSSSYISSSKPKTLSTPERSKSTNPSNTPEHRPEYDSYLSSVLLEHNSQKNVPKEFIDDLHFPIDQLPDFSNETQNTSVSSIANTSHNLPKLAWWDTEYRNNRKYVTVTNYIRAVRSFKSNSSVTLTTQATTEFLYHTLELCERWDGPLSIAVFCPGKELPVAITIIKYMRECLPAPLSACVRDKVTWHLVYNRSHGPGTSISYPRHQLDSKNFPLFANHGKCPKLKGPEPCDTIKQLEEDLSKRNEIFAPNYRQQFGLTYPINVLRNVARLASNTHYVLALDIELYPSTNLVPSFVNYISRHDVREEHKILAKGSGQDRHSFPFIFTLPIFEVKSNCKAPKTKPELIKMIREGDAIFFHKWVCDACQNFPHRLEWLEKDVLPNNDTDEVYDDKELKIFEVTQRDKTRDSWEPIFIGTNEDPLYDDQLSWDGRRDKMAQMYEMCLKNYYLLVLGNAFLVHAPGIKHIDRNDTMKRLNYIRENNAIYDATILKLKEKYKDSANLNRC